MMHWFYDNPMWHGVGGIFMILFWVMIIFIIISLWKKSVSGEGEGAEEILRKRYARGELSQEEFERMKKDLRQ